MENVPDKRPRQSLQATEQDISNISHNFLENLQTSCSMTNWHSQHCIHVSAITSAELPISHPYILVRAASRLFPRCLVASDFTRVEYLADNIRSLFDPVILTPNRHGYSRNIYLYTVPPRNSHNFPWPLWHPVASLCHPVIPHSVLQTSRII